MSIFTKQVKKLKSIIGDKESGSEYSIGTWSWSRKDDRFTLESFWKEKLGYGPESDVSNDYWRKLVHPDDLRKLVEKINAPDAEFIEIELRLKTSGDNWLWIFLFGKIISRKKNMAYRAEGIILDVSRQKLLEIEYNNKKIEIEALYEESEAQNEEMAAIMDELQRNQIELEDINQKLKKNEAQFRQVFENAPMGIVQTTLTGEILNANMSFVRCFGYDSLEDMKNSLTSTGDLYQDRSIRDEILEKIHIEQTVHLENTPGIRKDGTTGYYNVYFILLPDVSSNRKILTTFVEDVSELREARFERDMFFDYSGDLIAIMDMNGRLRQFNPAWSSLLGWDHGEIKATEMKHLLHPEDVEKTVDILRKIGKSDQTMSLTNRYRTKTGSYKIIRWSVIPFIDKKLVFASGRDETERYEAEFELKKMWDRLDIAINNGVIGLWDFNIKEGTLTINKSMSKLLGLDSNVISDITSKWSEYVHESDFPTSMKAMIEHLKGVKEFYIDEYRVRLANGDHRWFFSRGKIVDYDSSGKPARMAGSITDITEQKNAENRRKKVEEKMQQAQKLESLGILAGGIAHDFNNLLLGIMGNADIMFYELSDGSPLQHRLLEIKRAAKRASELTNQMLAYSGKGSFKIEPIDINDVIMEMESLLDTSISKKISILYELSTGLRLISGDVTQIRQVIMNLILNASEAIGNITGSITLRTYLTECTEETIDHLTMNYSMKPGNYLCMEIADTGCGIDPEKIKQIFDPFFTTKFTGRGLGLAAVSGIIKSHNAGLLVESRMNSGTTFKVYFPVMEEEAPVTEKPRKSGSIDTKRKNKTVLIADDEKYIRDLATKMLTIAGYNVLLAENGSQAITMFRENMKSIACIILDLTMPELDGIEALAEIRKISYTVPIIISSGYCESDIEGRFQDRNVSGFLQKPYQITELVDTIKKATGSRVDPV